MSALIPFDDACRDIFKRIEPLGIEFQDIAFAENFVLAEDAVAKRTSPFADLSAMDGYAVRAQDTGPGKKLTLIGHLPAGYSGTHFTVDKGLAVRIFTGAPIPAGADAVLIQENTMPGKDEQQIICTDTVCPKRFIRPKGVDFEHNNILIPRDQRLTAAHIALLLSGGISRLRVYRQPSVEIISTGDELVDASEWTAEQPHFLPASNGAMVRAILSKHGFGSFVQPIVSDRIASLQERFELLKNDTDLIISTGGASVGDHDIVRQFLDIHADQIIVRKIAMRPGKPLMLARIGAVWWLALPGNPVSSFVSTSIFGVGICRRLSGDTSPWPLLSHATLGADVEANDVRLEFMRAVLENGKITPFDEQDSSLLKRLSQANALLIRPSHSPTMHAGQLVQYMPI